MCFTAFDTMLPKIKKTKPGIRRLKLNNRQIIYVFLSIFLFTMDFVRSQTLNYSTVEHYDSIFKSANGLDQNLINGYQYINLYPNAKGHPFFNKNEFLQGNVKINNKVYEKVDLEYNIFKQKVVLKYKNSYGGTNQIELHNHAVTQFELDDKTFVYLSFPKIGNNYFQVISDNIIKCYYLWYKNIGHSSGSLDNYFVYSDQRKKTYLLMNEELLLYKGNRSFIKLFPKNIQNDIKRYIKENKIILRNVSDSKVKELIKYCENLIIEV